MKDNLIKVFLSYAWEKDKPKSEVLDLVRALNDLGYKATCDVYEMDKETAISFPKMMAKNIEEADKVVIVLSETYKEKADEFKGGVGREYQRIITDIEENKNKYILVSFMGCNEKILKLITPCFLAGRDTCDLSNWNHSSDGLKNEDCSKILYKISGTARYEKPTTNSQVYIPDTIKGNKADESHYGQEFIGAYKVKNTAGGETVYINPAPERFAASWVAYLGKESSKLTEDLDTLLAKSNLEERREDYKEFSKRLSALSGSFNYDVKKNLGLLKISIDNENLEFYLRDGYKDFSKKIRQIGEKYLSLPNTIDATNEINDVFRVFDSRIKQILDILNEKIVESSHYEIYDFGEETLDN